MINNLEKQVSEKNILIGQHRGEVSHLKDQLEWFRRQVFGQKSERFIDMPGNIPDLPGLDCPVAEEPEEIKIPSHKRKKNSGKGNCTLEIPEDLPRIENIIDVPEEERTCPMTEQPFKKIGEDRTEKLAFRPGEYYVKVTVRPKYAHPTDSRYGVVQEPAPTSILTGSKCDESFMAHIAVEKFVFHMPLYRIEEKLRSRKIRVTRQMLSKLILTLGENLFPLLDLMKRKLLEQGCIFTDDTHVDLQKKGKCIQSRMWVYIGGRPNAPPYHVYEFTEDRSHRHPLKFFENYKGLFHSDALGAYDKLALDDGIQWAPCWAHARRKFEESGKIDQKLRLVVLKLMRNLFLYERVAWNADEAGRLHIRQTKEKPIVDKLFSMMKEYVLAGNVLPSASLPIEYMLKREKYFRTYLYNPDARMDNNTAERGMRKLVIGRKNWLFFGSHTGGKATAALFSLIQTCRAMDINPQDYLEDVFRRMLDHPAKNLDDFLPDRWKELQKK